MSCVHILQSSSRRNRQGTVLIVVAGLAALLLTMFLVLARQVRSEVTDGVLVQRDAQARIMLSAALSFILEAGRLYGDQEGFGWTDVRDGSAGPKGPLTSGGEIPSTTPFLAEGQSLRVPMHAWKMPPFAVKPIVPYNPLLIPSHWLTEFENASTEEARWASTIGQILFPKFSDSPVATTWGQIPTKSQTPTYISPTVMGASPTDPIGLATLLPNDRGLYVLYNQVYQSYLYSPDLRPDYDQPYLHYGLQPQPVKDTLGEFAAGERIMRPESERRAWFRIYREKPEDHNGDRDPWYDRENMAGNHGVFIVTCGSGGTEGFKNAGQAGSRFDVAGKNRFDDLRRQERILWYRVRWSAYVGGGVDMASDYGACERQFPIISAKIQFSSLGGSALLGNQYPLRQATNRFLQRRYSVNPALDEQTLFINQAAVVADGAAPYQTNPRVLLNNLGTITMIERLEREPPTW